MKKHNPPVLALTLGEPAGIGPDVCLQAAQHALPAEVVVVGSPDLLYARAKQLDLSLTLKEWQPGSVPICNGFGKLSIIPIDLPSSCFPGTLNGENVPYVLQTLATAHTLCMDRQCDALVTGPVHKSLIRESDSSFLGHTEYFASLAGVQDVLMTFHTPEMIVAMTTTHYPLHAVSEKITAARLTKVVEILDQGLKKWFGIAAPCLAVCGLNPHAGEDGRLGVEEQDIIIPTLQSLRKKGYQLIGPVPGDTAFTPAARQSVDAIIAMYHDQGLAPIKALYFEEIVNVTLGLPYLRTSVDHGTALTLAGSGKSSYRSLMNAITLAATIVNHEKSLCS